MKALIYKGCETVVLEEIEKPRIRKGEALLRVTAASVSGTDMRIIRHGHHHIPQGYNRILGHEIAGIIEAVSPDVTTLSPGMAVAVAPNIHCGTCSPCRTDHTGLCENISPLGICHDGGFAEYMRIPAKAISQGNIIPVKQETDLAQAALNEPLSCCFNSLEYSGLSLGKTILIIGAGPIGIMHTLLANRMGAARIIVSEVSEARLTEIKRFGADLGINPLTQDLQQAVMDATGGRGVDVAIVACGVPSAHDDAIACLAARGCMNLFGGLPKDTPMTAINANTIHYNHLRVVGTTRQSINQYRKTLGLIESGKIDLSGLITGRFSLAEHARAFDAAQKGTGLKNVFIM
jgi:L-iditol 2-dehydrogenase